MGTPASDAGPGIRRPPGRQSWRLRWHRLEVRSGHHPWFWRAWVASTSLRDDPTAPHHTYQADSPRHPNHPSERLGLHRLPPAAAGLVPLRTSPVRSVDRGGPVAPAAPGGVGRTRRQGFAVGRHQAAAGPPGDLIEAISGAPPHQPSVAPALPKVLALVKSSKALADWEVALGTARITARYGDWSRHGRGLSRVRLVEALLALRISQTSHSGPCRSAQPANPHAY